MIFSWNVQIMYVRVCQNKINTKTYCIIIILYIPACFSHTLCLGVFVVIAPVPVFRSFMPPSPRSYQDQGFLYGEINMMHKNSLSKAKHSCNRGVIGLQRLLH